MRCCVMLNNVYLFGARCLAAVVHEVAYRCSQLRRVNGDRVAFYYDLPLPQVAIVEIEVELFSAGLMVVELIERFFIEAELIVHFDLMVLEVLLSGVFIFVKLLFKLLDVDDLLWVAVGEIEDLLFEPARFHSLPGLFVYRCGQLIDHIEEGLRKLPAALSGTRP